MRHLSAVLFFTCFVVASSLPFLAVLSLPLPFPPNPAYTLLRAFPWLETIFNGGKT